MPADRSTFADLTIPITVTISAGQSLSGQIDVWGCSLVAVHVPASWGSGAAITFAATEDGNQCIDTAAPFDPLRDEAGNEKTIVAPPAGQGAYVYLKPLDWVGARHLKVRSGTAAAPVNQPADVTLTLIVRPSLG